MSEISQLADKINNNMKVLKIFCMAKNDTEVITNILPIIIELSRDCDKLNNLIINDL